jgi:lipoate-protein ligase A
MKLYNLGKVPWQETQLIYHALAYLGRESLVLVSPASPYVCIGYHQDVTHEIDIDFCRKNNIPIFRREVGGGAVFLDGGQLFFHLILREDNPAIPPSKKAFYQKFLQPIVNVHRRIDIAAEYKPINDIIVNNRKISGTGVGEIGDCVVFVGNLILDFDYKMMYLTTIRRELDDNEIAGWDEAKLNALMAEGFGELLGTFEPAQKDDALISKMEALGSQMNDDAWLFRKGKPSSMRSVKIRSGVEVKHKMHKATGGLIRADFEMRDDILSHLSISGDFFCYPEDAVSQLESLLEGTATADVHNVLTNFCNRRDIEIPGVAIDDWTKVLSV